MENGAPHMTEKVDLSCPASSRYLYLVRVLVGAVASRLNMDVGEVEDLYLVVDELCLSLLNTGGAAPGELHIHLNWDDDTLEIHCRRTGVPAGTAANPPATSGLSAAFAEQILDALVDEHGASWEEDVPVAWIKKIRKRSPPAT